MLTPSVDQVARDQWLLDAARDYFHFVTEFFEVINISATHIYHSALELSPMSSIVRKLHYHRRLAPSPRVVVGNPDAWDEHISVWISQKEDSNRVPFAWSPCGRFIATRELQVVNIRDPLTFELLSTIQFTEYRRLYGPAYSPDGHSLACLSDTSVGIWDTQTGGMTKEIECNTVDCHIGSFVWSLDGRNILIAYANRMSKIWTVRTFDVASGVTLSTGTLQTIDAPYVWAHGTSFRIMIMEAVWNEDVNRLCAHCLFDVFEVGSALIKTESFSCNVRLGGKYTGIRFGSFSPTTHRISISSPDHLLVLNIQNSERSLDETGVYYAYTHYFFPDGSHFATSSYSVLRIWKYASNRYIPWRSLRHGADDSLSWGHLCFLFSPALSSVLSLFNGFLRVWRLDDPPTTLLTGARNLATVSRRGTHIITAHTEGNTVAITNLLTHVPSQIIDTGTKVEAIALTGDVLFTKSGVNITAWPLTEDGTVYDVFGNRRADFSDSIWTVSPAEVRAFSVDGHIGVVKLAGDALHTYHTGTGEVLEAPVPPLPALSWYSLSSVSHGEHRRPCLFEDGRTARPVILLHDWVKNLAGEHRLWVPIRWRTWCLQEDWPSDVMAVHPAGLGTVIIMF